MAEVSNKLSRLLVGFTEAGLQRDSRNACLCKPHVGY